MRRIRAALSLFAVSLIPWGMSGMRRKDRIAACAPSLPALKCKPMRGLVNLDQIQVGAVGD